MYCMAGEGGPLPIFQADTTHCSLARIHNLDFMVLRHFRADSSWHMRGTFQEEPVILCNGPQTNQTQLQERLEHGRNRSRHHPAYSQAEHQRCVEPCREKMGTDWRDNLFTAGISKVLGGTEAHWSDM